jgi:D-alanyl-D-alanine carboxypeptidase
MIRSARFAFWWLWLLLPGMVTPKARKNQTPPLQAALAKGVPDASIGAVLEVATPEGQWAVAQGQMDMHLGGRSVTPADRFRIGSVSKTFVAVAALQLAEAGAFQLDDDAYHWLPDEVVENLANAGKVTIRQLLQMRSGVPEYLGDAFMEAVWADPEREAPYTPTEALAFAYDKRARFKPGAKFSYTNSNYLLVQLVLEAVTGQPLHRLIRERILKPLALTQTYTQWHERKKDEVVHGYSDFPEDEEWNYDVTHVNDGAGLGDGGLISTTGDMIRFYQALFHDQRLLSAESLAALLDFQATGEEDEGYGLGIYSYESEWGSAYTHDGSVYGYVAAVLYLPDYEVTVAVACAHDGGDLYPVVDEVLNMVLGE